MECDNILKELIKSLDENKTAALATVVKAEGSTPARLGAKMLVFPDGTSKGTIGGGALELKVIETAIKAMRDNRPCLDKYDLTGKESSEIGMVCGGKVSILIEPFSKSPHMLIVGAGHISQHLSRIAKMLDFKVTVLDDREDFACQERFPEVDSIRVGDIADVLNEVDINKNTFIVIVTRGHIYDEVALEKVINSEAAYIGMIGSRLKTKTVFENLKKKGIPESLLEKVYAPIGLNLGGGRPVEIALSIMAEVVQVYYQGREESGGGCCDVP